VVTKWLLEVPNVPPATLKIKQESSDQTVRSRRLRPSVYETIRIRTKLIHGRFALLKKNISSQNINKYHLKAFSNITTYLIF
jgi:hypothetical protein